MIELVLVCNQTGRWWLPQKPGSPCPVMLEMWHGQIYDEEIVKAMKEYSSKEKTVIDAGACFGQMTVLLSPECKHVYSFEANPDVYDLLCKNVEENGCKNVSTFNVAVWDRDDEMLDFTLHQDAEKIISYGGGFVNDRRRGDFKVKSASIDSYGFEDVGIMKFDIQGADLRGMKGSIETIKRCQPAIIFECEDIGFKAVDTQAYLDFVEHIGYKVLRKIHSNNYVIISKGE